MSEIERFTRHDSGDMLRSKDGGWVRYPKHVADKRLTRQIALADAALVADQVSAKARPGDGKETADEIGRRIRALMEGTR